VTLPNVERPRVRLLRLALRDFRNFERQDVTFPSDGLVVIGENGHGKSNLLEAIYYLQLLRSVRGARDQDLVRFGAPGFHLGAVAERPDGARGAHEIGVGFERAGKRKRVRLDGAEPPRLSDALGAVPSVIFSPGDVRLYGSAGQQRTAAIALRLLEATTLRDASGAEPLFLLDDPFAELDARRAHRILELLGDAGLGQTVLVVPRATDIPTELTRLERTTIRDGVLGA
jgi:recombinational DNA repair ATPase RecF